MGLTAMGKKFLVLAIICFGLGGVFAVKFMPATPASLQTGFMFPEALELAPFSLVDQHNQAFTNEQLMGKWSLFFIGFTFCPDVCPTTLNKLSAAYPQLNAIAPLQIVFLSVDPKRDTPDKLLTYINFFNPEFKAVTGEQTQIFPLSRSLGLVYAMVGEGENYQVDHSAGYVLVSPKGERVAVFKPTVNQGKLPQILNQDLVADFEKIVKQYNSQH